MIPVTKVAQRRLALGGKVEDYAQAAKVSPQYWRMVEHGIMPKQDTQDRIAAALDTTADALFPGPWSVEEARSMNAAKRKR